MTKLHGKLVAILSSEEYEKRIQEYCSGQELTRVKACMFGLTQLALNSNSEKFLYVRDDVVKCTGISKDLLPATLHILHKCDIIRKSRIGKEFYFTLIFPVENCPLILDEIDIKRSNYLTKTERGMLKYVEEWNSKVNLTTHKLPEEGHEVSKTVKKICRYLLQVERGTFTRANNIPVENHVGVMEEKDIMNIIYIADKMYEGKYEIIPNSNTSFLNFLVNYKTKNSGFIDIYLNPPKVIKDIRNIIVADKYMSLYNDLFDKVDSRTSTSIKRCVALVIMEYREIMEGQQGCYDHWGKWDSWIGSEEAFLKLHVEFLKDFKTDKLYLGHLKVGRGIGIWDCFITNIETKFDVKIYMNDSERKIIMQNRKRSLLKSGSKKISDFNGLLLEG